jgi:hypothetical protein
MFARIIGYKARVAALAQQRRRLCKARERCSNALTALHAGRPDRERALCTAQSELSECERMQASHTYNHAELLVFYSEYECLFSTANMSSYTLSNISTVMKCSTVPQGCYTVERIHSA